MYGKKYRQLSISRDAIWSVFGCLGFYSSIASSFIFVFVHAACDQDDRVHLWRDIGNLDNSLPMMFCGDFKVIVSSEEKKGGRPFKAVETFNFLNFINFLQHKDVGFTGSKFTWCNNQFGRVRVWKRLDRLLVNQKWMDFNCSNSVVHLNRFSPDHSPLLMVLKPSINGSPKSFKFLNFWCSYTKFWGLYSRSCPC